MWAFIRKFHQEEPLYFLKLVGFNSIAIPVSLAGFEETFVNMTYRILVNRNLCLEFFLEELPGLEEQCMLLVVSQMI